MWAASLKSWDYRRANLNISRTAIRFIALAQRDLDYAFIRGGCVRARADR